ncbi:unnamed protein product [Dovyalis caffra]|uniref:Uncharacterized protein n=1 Tax=Dovyalis caffra TaxID=77055 RepID=A0AAV1RD39_9ROSI|nr:unnamed protein product [Dovyalis caffra]
MAGKDRYSKKMVPSAAKDVVMQDESNFLRPSEKHNALWTVALPRALIRSQGPSRSAASLTPLTKDQSRRMAEYTN